MQERERDTSTLLAGGIAWPRTIHDRGSPRDRGEPEISSTHKQLKASVRLCLVGDSGFVGYSSKHPYPIGGKLATKCWSGSGYQEADLPYWHADPGATASSMSASLYMLFEAISRDNSIAPNEGHQQGCRPRRSQCMCIWSGPMVIDPGQNSAEVKPKLAEPGRISTQVQNTSGRFRAILVGSGRRLP